VSMTDDHYQVDVACQLHPLTIEAGESGSSIQGRAIAPVEEEEEDIYLTQINCSSISAIFELQQ